MPNDKTLSLTMLFFGIKKSHVYHEMEANTIRTDVIPTDDRDRVKVLGIGLVVGLGFIASE